MIDPQSIYPLTRKRLTHAAVCCMGGVFFGALIGRSFAAEEPAPTPLTRIIDVLELPSERAALGLPVHVRGVVTWIGGGLDFVVQDPSGGIYVHMGKALRDRIYQSGGQTPPALREGAEIELDAHSNPGGSGPDLMPVAVRVLGIQPLPQAVPMVPSRFFKGADCGRRVQVRAVVRAAQKSPSYDKRWTLLLDTDPGLILSDISQVVCDDPAKLVDAEVLLSGVAMTRFNTRGEATTPRLNTNIPEDLIVEKPAPPPESVPQVSLGRIQPFTPVRPGPHRVRVEGTVTFCLPGNFLYLQDGINALRVETDTPLEMKPGDRVEAIGFVEMAREIGMLSSASVRKIGSGKEPVATDISPEEIMNINTSAANTNQMAIPHDYDGHLVRFRARLLAVQTDPNNPHLQRSLLLERPTLGNKDTSGLILKANLQSGPARGLDVLQPGSELEVSGLVQISYGPSKDNRFRRVPTQIDLILRNAQDVVVIHDPSWWTAGRLLGLLGLTALILAAAIFWSILLNRKVGRNTLLLTGEMRARRDASVEFQATLRERNQLAANLHDTLLQTMGGLGFQLEACEAEAAAPAAHDRPPVHLAFARRMLDHAVDELRNSVWTLRSMPLEGLSLPDALVSIARRMGEGRETRIHVLSEPIPVRVPDFISGNLLLVAQEALHNALKHAAPTTVTLEVRALKHPARIVLTVSDDGTGFNAATQRRVAEGHFGLLGMRERIDRLGGTFRIQSTPGKGTTIHAEVPLHAYDNDMADRPIDKPSSGT